MFKLTKALIVMALLTTGLMAKTQDIQIFTSSNKDGKITAESVEKAFADLDFIIDVNNNMNIAFKAKFKNTRHDLYHLFVVHNSKFVSTLSKKYTSVGLFSPMSMSLYSRTGSHNFSISSLTLDGWSKITGIPKTDKDLVAYTELVTKALKKAMPNGKFEKVNYNIETKKGKLVSNFTYKMDPKLDFIEQKEDFQEEVEGELESMGFVYPSFVEFSAEFEAEGNTEYEIFDAYSICKISVIYAVSEKRPEAGAYAPCTLFMYQKKGESELHISFPTVYNWISSMDMDDANAIKILKKAQNDFAGILREATE